MVASTVFINNRSQAVRFPAELRLPPDVKHVDVRARGHERIIAPMDRSWDSFFVDGPLVTDDFMTERGAQNQPDRDAL